MRKKTSLQKSIIDNKQSYMIVDSVPGSLFAVDSKAFKRIKGFDENTFLYFEEYCLAHKIKKIGMKEALLLDVTYYHNHDKASSSNIKLFKYYRSSRKYCLYTYYRLNFFEKIIFNVFDFVSWLERRIYKLLFRRG